MRTIIISYKKEYSFRERMLLWLLGKVVPVHAQFYKRRQPWNLQREDLKQYPAASLGHELGLFLERESLQPVDRIERHDAFHILLGFSTQLRDEAAMQFFLIGNGKISPFTAGTALFTLLTMPDHWGYFYRQYKRGQATRCIAKWDFLQLLDERFEEVRELIFTGTSANAMLLHKVETFERVNKAYAVV